MLEQLNAKVDAAVMKDKRRSRRHSDYGRRAHQPDPNAKYGSTTIQGASHQGESEQRK